MIPVPVMGMGVVIRLVPVVVPLGTRSIMAVTIPCGHRERNSSLRVPALAPGAGRQCRDRYR